MERLHQASLVRHPSGHFPGERPGTDAASIMACAAAASATAIALTTMGGKIIYANPAFLSMWGYREASEVVGRPMEGFWEGGEYRRICAAVNQESRWIGEMTAHRSDGTSRDLHLSAAMINDPSGRPLGVVCSCVDITDRKRIEKELQTRNGLLSVINRIVGVAGSLRSLDEMVKVSLDRTRTALEGEVGGIYMLDRDRSRALLYHQVGIPERSLVRYRTLVAGEGPLSSTFSGGPPRYIVSGSGSLVEEKILEDLEVDRLACIPLVGGGEPVGGLLLGRRGTRAFSREERSLLEVIGREVGASILKGRLDERLEVAHQEANLYLDIMTHDIRNAENVANLYADMLIDMLDGEPAQLALKLRASIRKSIDILGTVSTIRKIRQECPILVPVDLSEVARREAATFPEARIRCSLPPIRVMADNLLPEIFTNLLGNAVKFGGPEVEIGIRIEDLGDDVLVSVEDTGPGVLDTKKRAIFQRFERATYTERGEGLGLYICWMLIDRYGGSIWVDDRVAGHPECGAAFRFTLKKCLPE